MLIPSAPFAPPWNLSTPAHNGPLEKSGTLISQPDLWIAAITRAAGGTLVTHNTHEFSRVPGLMLEDWLKP